MGTFIYRNVNDAFSHLVRYVQEFESRMDRSYNLCKTSSRNGDVIQFTEPVTVTYMKPRERVLLFAGRDANPFFHLVESMWMLSGRNDVKPLSEYNSNIANYSDNGELFHGAYGYRWRNWFGYDQLKIVAKELRDNPSSRRCVVAMWDASSMYGAYRWNMDDDSKVMKFEESPDLYVATHGGKDVPCNTHIYFSINPESGALDMTVCNRSNDMIWGMLGANVVHLSFLQEYMAEWIGVSVGRYNQITNNLHVYLDKWKPEDWIHPNYVSLQNPYEREDVFPVPMFMDGEGVEDIDEASKLLFDLNDLEGAAQTSTFFDKVVVPMVRAFRSHKDRDYNAAIEYMKEVKSLDWKIAGATWIIKRRDNYERKVQAGTN